MRTRWPAFMMAAFFLLAGSASAHDTWLIPDRFRVAPGTSIVLDLTSSMTFPEAETPVQPDRIERAMLRLGGRKTNVIERAIATRALRLTAALGEAGIGALAVDLKPKAIELQPEQVAEYLKEIGSPATVVETWNRMPAPKQWRELYSKHAKTFVRVGEPAADGSWAEPIGLALEIVPDKDPTGLRAGDELPLRVLKAGQPLAGFVLELVPQGGHSGTRQTTDPTGRATFRIDHAGRWLLRGTEVRKSNRGDSDWESDFTTLTFEVR